MQYKRTQLPLANHSQGDLAKGQRKNGQERGTRSGERGPKQLYQRLLHPVIAIVAGSEQEASPDVGCELDHQTNLRPTTVEYGLVNMRKLVSRKLDKSHTAETIRWTMLIASIVSHHHAKVDDGEAIQAHIVQCQEPENLWS